MADVNTTPILSAYATVGSRLSDLRILDGQLIWVQDKRMIALDFGGKRTFYTQIEELATDGARTSMLAPVTGIFYYVVETAVLWTYQDGWVQITTPPNELLVLDASLAQEGKAADAKVVGDAINNINSYIFNIDYNAVLAFDTSEIVFASNTNTTSVLGQAILGQMVLA